MKGRILVVEDSYLIAFEYAAWLRRANFEVIGPAATVHDALELAHAQEVDAAILDIQVGRDKCFSIAGTLATKGIPFAFLTGYTADMISTDLQSYPVVIKPAMEGVFLEVVRSLMTRSASAQVEDHEKRARGA